MRQTSGVLSGVIAALVGLPAVAQELEPRRWSHLPSDHNLANVTYASTNGDIAFDPVLGIADAEVDLETVFIGYVRTFALLDRSARVEIRQTWHNGEWTGLVNGVPTAIVRDGLADLSLRLAVNLVGAPPLAGARYGAYRAATSIETIVGAAIVVHVPTGEYFEDKLINLGSNRFTIRPQLGIQHRRGRWTFEATATAWMYTDNDAFFNGNRLGQEPLVTLDGTVIHAFASGLWTSLSVGYGAGGRTAVNGRANGDYREDVSWAIGIGIPVTRSLGFRISFVDSHRWRFIGNESQTISLGVSASWR